MASEGRARAEREACSRSEPQRRFGAVQGPQAGAQGESPSALALGRTLTVVGGGSLGVAAPATASDTRGSSARDRDRRQGLAKREPDCAEGLCAGRADVAIAVHWSLMEGARAP